MTVPTNAYRRQDQTNVFEDYEDIIYDYSPVETPFVTSLAQRPATNSLHEFTEDTLDAPANPAVSDGNSWLDGDNFSAQAITPPVKLGNECQVQRKDFNVTRRAQVVDKAGNDDEVDRQAVRKGRELKRDMEATVLFNQAKRAETGTTVALLGGLPTWIAGLTDGRANRGATGTDPTGDGSNVKGDGTKRALSEAGMLGVSQAVYQVSRELPDCWLLDIKSKGNFSSYMFSSSARIANPYQQVQPAGTPGNDGGGMTAVGSVSIWESDFGRQAVKGDRFMPLRVAGDGYDAFLYCMDVAASAFLTNMRRFDLAPRGDSLDTIMLVDWTFVPLDRKCYGTFADVDESLSMVA